jgi:octaprenyl-diphosphate synthase
LKPPAKLEQIVAPIHEDLDQVERVLREGVRSVAPLLSEAGDYTFAAGGKRVRPVLVLLAARLCGYRGPRAIQVAAAAECLHTATLTHDDVVDGADLRRGRPSVNAQFGTRLAILVGDFLLAQSSSLLVADGNADILAIYADSIRQMAEGEVLQLMRSFDPDIPESVYLDVIGRKTATSIAAAAEAGSILGGVTLSERRAVREYGWQVGLAFQLIDDALDYSSSGEELGKAQLTDLAEGKVTLPLLLTLKRCSTAERDEIHAAVKAFAAATARADEEPPDASRLSRVADLVTQHRGSELAEERARKCAEAAIASIDPFVDCEAKRALGELAWFVVSRRA